ncbi:DUF2975 domain-containing protein [Azospirillum sp. B510]|uniref:DUF2975 domain-containing protein n=1 Tax=Azospirillum sp. (strain B510) TaxID=137722 RepID=UPI001FFF9FAE|nr:DUF2975 domain-containing protein [Azospirillum sp. B510]
MAPSQMTAGVPGAGREARISRIRGFSRWMAAGCLVTSALLAAGMLFYWIATPAPVLLGQSGVRYDPGIDLDISRRAMAFAISMVPLGALIFGLLSARRCFAGFAMGRIFTPQSIGSLQAFSLGIAASAILRPLAGAALSVLLSWDGPKGEKTFALIIGSDSLIALIFAGIVAAFAWIMAEAVEISDENNQFV